jgi:hypothetical protein
MKTQPNFLVRSLKRALACSVLLCFGASGAQFEDITQAAGLTNFNAYCIGLAWGDYDDDGRVDLYIAAGGPGTGTNALYRNTGGGLFERIGAEAGPIATDKHSSLGCAWGDFNNDGHRDLFVVNGGWSNAANALYWNHGDGSFSRGNVGDLTGLSRVHSWHAIADYDGDGLLDIYASEAASGSGPFYLRLYRGTGIGTFTPTDFAPSVNYANDGVWGDFDNDGDPDLYACNFSSPSTLWRNDGEGQFTAMPDDLPAHAGALHAAWADYDNDGDLDIAIGYFSGVSIYSNEGGGAFVQAANFSGSLTTPAWADYDNDGHLDLMVVGGQDTPAKAGLFHNNGDGTFTPATEVFTELADNWLGCAWGDIDDDGFMDLAMAHQHGRNALFRNLTNDNHWLKFKLVGTASNRDAIGAKVRVLATIGGQAVWQMQEVNGGYQIQNDTRLNFGLGDATSVDIVRIEWPSGNVQEYSDVASDQIRTVTERSGITPLRPTVSLNASVKLQTTGRGSLQWRFEGADLAGQTNTTLVLTNLVAEQEGRYSAVISNAAGIVTNFTYLLVDTQFRKVTEGPGAEKDNCYSAAWSDYNRDGYIDLLVCNGGYIGSRANFLHLNNGDGTFTRLTIDDVGSIVGDTGGWRSAAWGDYDNDGYPDLFIVQPGQRRLYHNTGDGGFARVGDQELVSAVTHVEGALWGDYDNDGWLDVLVVSGSNGYIVPGSNSLYHNERNGIFRKITTGPISLDIPGGDVSYGGAWTDFDNDGDLDLVIAGGNNYRMFVYRNLGQGQFQAITEGDLPQDRCYALYLTAADYDNDGLMDLFLADFDGSCRLFHNEGGGNFTKIIFTQGATHAQYGAWGDYDNDGYLDLFIACGEWTEAKSRFYHNNGDGTFTELTIGSPANELGEWRAIWGDYDNDGFLDLFVGEYGQRGNVLYHNEGNANHWLMFNLEGTGSNRGAVGAKVRVQATVGGRLIWQLREVSGGNIYQQDSRPHFGLGNARKVTLLRVEWPSGAAQEWANVAVDQILTLWEPPALAAAVQPDGACALSIRAEPNRAWQIQASNDLAEWQTLTPMTSGTVDFEFVDSSATGMDCRFYRIIPE